jgi:xanthine permease XanP
MDRKKALDRILPPFAEVQREKPRDMLYTASDRPPWSTTLSAGLQHALVALMLVVYSVIVGQAIGLHDTDLRDFVALGILVMGFGTLLNGLATRMSAGHLLVKIPNPITMFVFIAVANALGPGAAAGGILVAGLLVMVLGRFLPLLRLLFPAEVTGIMLMLLGMSLIPGGIDRAAGLEADGLARLDRDAVLIAAVTLGTIVGLSVWSSGRARVLALLIGAGAGLAVAVTTGHFGGEELTQVASQPWFAVPGAQYQAPTPVWVAAAIIPFFLVAIVDAVDTVGCAVTIDRMTNKQWKRPDLPMIGRLLYGFGLCHLLSGLTGTVMTALSSANLGLAHVTGVAARRVGVVAGILLMLLAFLPQITTFVILLPAAVVGAILLYTAAYMMVSGAELILSRLLDARRRAVVGLSLMAGSAVFMLPELTSRLSPELEPLLGSGLMVGTLCAIALNLLFRIGIARQAESALDSKLPAAQATGFLEDRGADWGARREVIVRAGVAVGEALEALRQAGAMDGPAHLKASFDEETLSLTLSYPGRAVGLAALQPFDARALLEMDDDAPALDAAMANLSGVLVRNLADRVDSRAGAGRAELRLQFNH